MRAGDTLPRKNYPTEVYAKSLKPIFKTECSALKLSPIPWLRTRSIRRLSPALLTENLGQGIVVKDTGSGPLNETRETCQPIVIPGSYLHPDF